VAAAESATKLRNSRLSFASLISMSFCIESLGQDDAEAPTDWASALTPVIGPEGAAGSQAVGAAVASISNVTRIDQRSLSLGMRWDVHPQMALKAQVDHIRVGANGAGLWARATSDARIANVLSLVVDTVF
jgi:nicotinamide mononucleotide (NMN) deamidase PncC